MNLRFDNRKRPVVAKLVILAIVLFASFNLLHCVNLQQAAAYGKSLLQAQTKTKNRETDFNDMRKSVVDKMCKLAKQLYNSQEKIKKLEKEITNLETQKADLKVKLLVDLEESFSSINKEAPRLKSVKLTGLGQMTWRLDKPRQCKQAGEDLDAIDRQICVKKDTIGSQNAKIVDTMIKMRSESRLFEQCYNSCARSQILERALVGHISNCSDALSINQLVEAMMAQNQNANQRHPVGQDEEGSDDRSRDSPTSSGCPSEESAEVDQERARARAEAQVAIIIKSCLEQLTRMEYASVSVLPRFCPLRLRRMSCPRALRRMRYTFNHRVRCYKRRN